MNKNYDKIYNLLKELYLDVKKDTKFAICQLIRGHDTPYYPILEYNEIKAYDTFLNVPFDIRIYSTHNDIYVDGYYFNSFAEVKKYIKKKLREKKEKMTKIIGEKENEKCL